MKNLKYLVLIVIAILLVSCGTTPSLPKQELKLDKSEYLIECGDKVNYVVQVIGIDEYIVSIGDSTIAQLNENDKAITGLKIGETTLTVKHNDLTATAKVKVSEKRLSAPTISKNNNILNWDAIGNGSSYEVYLNDKLVKTISTNSIDVTDLLDYKVDENIFYITAMSSSDNYIKSNKSNEIKYESFTSISFVTYNNNTLNSIRQSRGSDVVIEEISKTGFVFDGWYLDSEFEIPFDGKTPNINITLYAKWTPNTTDLEDLLKQEIDETMIEYIDSLINQTSSCVPAWNKESFKGKWNYIDGVFLNSIVNLYYQTLSDENIEKAEFYKDFFIRYINYYIDENGYFLKIDKNGNKTNILNDGFATTELDTICSSKILFDAYSMTSDSRYLIAIEYTYNALIRMSRITNGSNFFHKEGYTQQIWLDGMYMYAPFYAKYAKMKNNNDIFDEIKTQYEYIRNHMYNEEKDLYYHGYDYSRNQGWADEITGCSENFWLRSTGWFIVSLTDVIEYFPEGSNKDYLISLLNEAVEGIIKYQDSETKMFYQLIDKGKDFSANVNGFYFAAINNTKYNSIFNSYETANISNYLETSGSSMIAYTLLKSSKLGYIDSTYSLKGIEIFEGIYDYSLSKDGNELELKNICITAGLGSTSRGSAQYFWRDGSAEYYLAEPVGSNDAKGVGPFIMAYLEYCAAKSTLK